MIQTWSTLAVEAFLASRNAYGDPCAYEQATLYLAQSMRRGGWYSLTPRGFVAIAKDYDGDGRHALVCAMGPDVGDLILATVDACAAAAITVVRVKHVRPETAEQLLVTGRFAPAAQVLAKAWLDDLSEENYPRIVIDLQSTEWTDARVAGVETVLPTTPSLADFRYQVRRFGRRLDGSRKATVQIQTLGNLTLGECEELLVRWSSVVETRFGKRGWPQVRNVQSCLLEPNRAVLESALSRTDGPVGELVRVGEVPAALWIGEAVSSTCLGLYALIADTTVFNLAYWILLRALVHARTAGMRFVALGGSETENLFRFKSLSHGRGSDVCKLDRAQDLVCRSGDPRVPSPFDLGARETRDHS